MAAAVSPELNADDLDRLFLDLRAIALGKGRTKWTGIYRDTVIAPHERLRSEGPWHRTSYLFSEKPTCLQAHLDLFDSSSDSDFDCDTDDANEDDDEFWGGQHSSKAQIDNAIQPDETVDGWGDRDDAGEEEEDKLGDSDGELSDQEEDSDEAYADSSKDLLQSEILQDYISRYSYLGGVGLDIFLQSGEEVAYVSDFALPPTMPGFVKLPQPSADQTAEDLEHERRILDVLQKMQWCPAFTPGRFRDMCRRWPKGYCVHPSSLLNWGYRPLHRLLPTKNPICAWLPPNIIQPKGWMVYEAQLQDIKRFMQFQYHIRRLPVNKERISEVDDPDLPPEYYNSFPKNYLHRGYKNFLHNWSAVEGRPHVKFDLEDPTHQDLVTTHAEYVLYTAHRFHVVARAVRATQLGAERSFETIRASGILDEVEAGTAAWRRGRNAKLRRYFNATATWREAMIELMPLWYRMKWAGRRVIKLRMHTVKAEARLKREQKMVVAESQSRVESGNGLYQENTAPTTVGAKRKADDKIEAAADNSAAVAVRPMKQVKTGAPPDSSTIKHALLAQYYPRVHTLRAWALEKLQTTSRPQKRKFASVGLLAGANDLKRDLGYLLDTTLVAEAHGDSMVERPGVDAKTVAAARWEQWAKFRQKGDNARLAGFRQEEIVDFVIWYLLKQNSIKRSSWPNNLLCDGFRTESRPRSNQYTSRKKTLAYPFNNQRVVALHKNQRADAIKIWPWQDLLRLLREESEEDEGERIMINLLLDYSIFTAVQAGKGNLYQLSGEPISEIKTMAVGAAEAKKAAPKNIGKSKVEHSPSGITFVRSRMLYARAPLNAQGVVSPGLRRVHILNRCPYIAPPASSEIHENTVRVMMYIFPRQFGLHNVFTSIVDRKKTTQKFQNYTLREQEISAKFSTNNSVVKPLQSYIPKRLKGSATQLAKKLQVLHKRCSYTKLFQHYCLAHKHKQQSSSLINLATPVSQVSAFCCAVLSKIIPNDFWGRGEACKYNKNIFLHKVDHFIRLGRFESMTLHEVLQGMKLSSVDWLAASGLHAYKASQTDTTKRIELFSEFLYFMLDSIVMPLVSSYFYVTESNAHGNRLFYFPHETWQRVAKTATATLKTSMFEEVHERSIDVQRSLGYSHVRLLPKEDGLRPVMNLSRRRLAEGAARPKVLSPSINTVLAPVGQMLRLERELHPERLGSAIFSVGDIYTRIKAFKARVLASSSPSTSLPPFYFAKVDVKAAFDTIPQEAVVALMRTIPTYQRYQTFRYARVLPLNNDGVATIAACRWLGGAQPANETVPFAMLLEGTGKIAANSMRNTVFVDGVVRKDHDVDALLQLLEAHIQHNVVHIGKNQYRQRCGIPQGSVLSSALCNYFYADLEAKHLSFLQEGPAGDKDCLLARLVDDFIIISTSKTKVERFVTAMHNGFPEYGVSTNENKSKVNFALEVNRVTIATTKEPWFSYCGILINTATLQITKDRKVKISSIFNSLTVEFSRHQGRAFQRKIISAFKIQMHPMFIDTEHNGQPTVMAYVSGAAAETAVKLTAYIRRLPRAQRPRQSLVMRTLAALADSASRLLQGHAWHASYPGYTCLLRPGPVAWLVFAACHRVLTIRQSSYTKVLSWLKAKMAKLEKRSDMDMAVLGKALEEGVKTAVG